MKEKIEDCFFRFIVSNELNFNEVMNSQVFEIMRASGKLWWYIFKTVIHLIMSVVYVKFLLCIQISLQ